MPLVQTEALDIVLDEGETIQAFVEKMRTQYHALTFDVIADEGPNIHPCVQVTGSEHSVKRVLRDWGYAVESTPGSPTSTRYTDLYHRL